MESQFFDISKLFIQCNKDSCYEHRTIGVNTYLNVCVSLLVPECAVSLCVSDQMNVPAKNHDTCQKEGCWEKRGGVFQGRGWGCIFYKKMKYNLKYSTTKKVYKQKCFSVSIKNLNCRVKDEKLWGFTGKSNF